MNIKRTCAHPECETPITQGNKSGYCTKHFYWSKKKSQTHGANRSARKASPPRKSIAKPNGAVATICVTESNLDAFWAKLSIEEKADLFSKQLEAN